MQRKSIQMNQYKPYDKIQFFSSFLQISFETKKVPFIIAQDQINHTFINNSNVVIKIKQNFQFIKTSNMGNTQNKNQPHREIQSFHQKFKKVQVLENSEEMILTIPYEQKEDLLEWQKLLKTVKQCDPEFLLMPKKYMIAEQGLCGSSGVIKIVFDSFTFSFEQEIRNHAQKYKHFEEAQVWYLLFAIISSVKEMDRLSIKVGDIRPYNIFVNQNGQVKLSGVYSWPREIENFLKTSYDKAVTYLAPEELNQCRFGQKGKKSHITGESFSIGLTLLHTCMLKSMDELYNVKKFEFDSQKLQNQINQLRNLKFWNEEKQINQKYSESLISVIAAMLQLDESKRLTSLQLFQELQPHAEEILNLRQFQLPTFKIESTNNMPVNSIGKIPANSKTKLSPQYSSIQKKQYNEPQSLAFEASHNFVIPSTKTVPTTKTVPNYTIGQKLTPEKSRKSKQKLQISLSNDKKNAASKTVQPVRENVSKESLGYDVGANLTSIGKTALSYPVNNPLPGEFKLGDNQSYRPSINSTLNGFPQYGEKKYEVPAVTFNSQPVSNYASYQPKFDIPSTAQYRTVTQQPTYYFNQTSSYVSKQSLGENQASFIPTTMNYPFSKNIDLTKSQYTYIENAKSFGLQKEKVSFGLINQEIGYTQTTAQNYHTSNVVPFVSGQTTFATGVSTLTDNRPPLVGGEYDLLKKIDEQLNKSKQMYPTGKAL